MASWLAVSEIIAARSVVGSGGSWMPAGVEATLEPVARRSALHVAATGLHRIVRFDL